MRTVSLSEITRELESGSRPTGGATDESAGILSLGGEHVSGDGSLTLGTKRFIPLTYFERMRRGRLQRDDILIVKDGATTGKVGFVDSHLALPAAVNEHVFRLAVDTAVAQPRYVFFHLLSQTGNRQILKDFRGATVGGISQDFLEQVEIPLPDLTEQRRIAGRLQEADRLRRIRRYGLELTDNLLRAAFIELFGDPIAADERFPSAELGAVTDFIDYRGIAPNKVSSGVRLVTARNIKRGYFEIEPQEFIPAEDYGSWMTRGLPRPGDVLFTTEGHTLGSAAKLPPFKKVALAQRLIALQPKGQITSDYLLYVILHPSFQDRVVKHSTGSAARGISSKNLAGLPISLPPLSLQVKFAALVERTEHLRAVQCEAMRQAEHLFSSLLDRAFNADREPISTTQIAVPAGAPR